MISNEGKTVVTGPERGSVLLWFLESELDKGDSLDAHPDFVMHVAMSNNGKTIVSWPYDGTLRRWSAESGLSTG